MPFELTIAPSIEEKMWTKHRVLPDEVREALDDPNLRRFLVNRNRKAREITYLYVGLTYTDRLLRSIIIHKPDGSAYLKTSLDAQAFIITLSRADQERDEAEHCSV